VCLGVWNYSPARFFACHYNMSLAYVSEMVKGNKLKKFVIGFLPTDTLTRMTIKERVEMNNEYKYAIPSKYVDAGTDTGRVCGFIIRFWTQFTKFTLCSGP